jgi:YVTN family beta-propeller protein
VSVIDVSGRAVKATVKVGAGPSAAQPGPDGLVFVANEIDETISVIDAAKLEVVRTFALGFHPGAISSNAGELWIPAPARGGVEIRDAQGNVLRFIATGLGAHAVAFSGDGQRAWVSNQDDDSVSVIDRSTFTTVAKIAVGAKPNGLAWRAR